MICFMIREKIKYWLDSNTVGSSRKSGGFMERAKFATESGIDPRAKRLSITNHRRSSAGRFWVLFHGTAFNYVRCIHGNGIYLVLLDCVFFPLVLRRPLMWFSSIRKYSIKRLIVVLRWLAPIGLIEWLVGICRSKLRCFSAKAWTSCRTIPCSAFLFLLSFLFYRVLPSSGKLDRTGDERRVTAGVVVPSFLRTIHLGGQSPTITDRGSEIEGGL